MWWEQKDFLMHNSEVDKTLVLLLDWNKLMTCITNSYFPEWIKINIKEENLKSIDKYAGTKLALFHANSALLNSYHHP